MIPSPGKPVVLREYLPVECDPVTGRPLDWDRCRTCFGSGIVDLGAGDVNPPGAPERIEVACEACGGFGSLKAAALYFKATRVAQSGHGACGGTGKLTQVWPQADSSGDIGDDCHCMTLELRCEGCGHLEDAGIWEPPEGGNWIGDERDQLDDLEHAERCFRQGVEPGVTPGRGVHWTPCDERCNHGGPQRIENTTEERWDATPTTDDALIRAARESAFGHGWRVEASWRLVQLRVGEVARKTMGAAFGPKNPLHVRPWDMRAANLAILCLRCWAERS